MMSAQVKTESDGPKSVTSALRPEAASSRTSWYVGFVPTSDIAITDGA